MPHNVPACFGVRQGLTLKMIACAFIFGDTSVAQEVSTDTAATSDFNERWTLKPRVSFDARTRYQSIQRDLETDGEALTLRLEATVELDIAPKTVLIGELEGVIALIDEFDDGTRPESGLPFIPDPNGLELNRLAITTEAIDQVRVTAGRQTLALDDWRFIGAFPFRQNQQTFDAVRFETTAIGPGTLDLGYFGRVLRPLGADNPGGRFTGDSFYANYNVQTPVGRLTAFHYSLDLETGPEGVERQILSNQVTGTRLFGRQHWDDFGVVWDFAYARQSDHAGNPEEFDADYILAQFTVEPGRSGFTLRAETLGSDNGQGFQTPLASLHRFQGFADQFLQTPDDGVQDISLLARHDLGQLGVFQNVRAFVRHHWFESDVGDNPFGTEWNFSISGQVGDVSVSVEYADYNADTFSTDTRVLFLTTQLGF